MQQKYQTSEREASQAWQKMMLDYINSYNSPVAVMGRLNEAGLSPDLMYGQNGVSAMMSGSVPGSTNGSAPSVPTPAGEASSMQSSAALGDAAFRAAQISNMKEDTNVKKAEQANLKSLTAINGVELTLKGKYLDISDQQLKNMQIEYDQFANKIKEIQSVVAMNQSVEALNRQELYEAKQTFKSRFAQIEYENAQLDVRVKMDKETLRSLGEFIEAQIDLMNDQAFAAQQQGKGLSLQNIDLQKMQEAQRRFRMKNAAGDQLTYYDVATSMYIAQMTGNTAMLNRQIELLNSYGGYQAVMEPLSNIVSSMLGAYVGARTSKATPARSVVKEFGR